jgi:hypothetical protein
MQDAASKTKKGRKKKGRQKRGDQGLVRRAQKSARPIDAATPTAPVCFLCTHTHTHTHTRTHAHSLSHSTSTHTQRPNHANTLFVQIDTHQYTQTKQEKQGALTAMTNAQLSDDMHKCIRVLFFVRNSCSNSENRTTNLAM